MPIRGILGVQLLLQPFRGSEQALYEQADVEPRCVLSALINFRCIANGLWTTEETVKKLG